MKGRDKRKAKVNCKNALKSVKLGGRIVGVKTVDKMTVHQITAKVRRCILKLDFPMGSN